MMMIHTRRSEKEERKFLYEPQEEDEGGLYTIMVRQLDPVYTTRKKNKCQFTGYKQRQEIGVLSYSFTVHFWQVDHILLLRGVSLSNNMMIAVLPLQLPCPAV